MPEQSEFEEKEFESQFVYALGVGAEFWTPGQVLEHRTGTEVVVAASEATMRAVGLPWYFGIWLNNPFWWKLITKSWPSAGAPPPDFRASAFFQVKRSSKYKVLISRLKAKGFTRPGWFFDITPHQQLVMEQLEQKLAGAAVVAYVAPAFDTRAALHNHARAGTLLSNATFPPASALRGHTRWAYERGGAVGAALSEPVYFEGPTIVERLNHLRAGAGTPQLRGAEQLQGQLDTIWNALQHAAASISPDHDGLRVLFNETTARAGESENRLAGTFARIQVGVVILGLRWLVVVPSTTSTEQLKGDTNETP